jgi:chromate transporter
MPELNTISHFGWSVIRDANRTLGGGWAAIELLRRTFIGTGALAEEGHAGLVAVSRLTPGTNLLAYCVALGWRMHGWAGSLTALVAASVPGSIIVFALTAALVRVDQYSFVRFALAVGILAAMVLVLSSAWSLLRPYLTASALASTIVIIALSAALLLAGLTPVRILLVSAAAGAMLGRPLRAHAEGQ